MLFTLIIFCALIFYLSGINYRKVYLSLKIPGPFPLPFVGNALMLLLTKSSDHIVIAEKIIGNKDIIRGWIKSDLIVFLSDPKAVETLLSSKNYIEKSILYKFITPWLNEGLLLSKGAKWFQRRKLLTPAFHFKILEQFVEVFDRQSDYLVNNLNRYSKGEKVELFPLVTNYALDVICESAMGTQLSAQQSMNQEYVSAVKKMSHVIHFRMTKFYLREDWIFRLTSLYNEEKEALRLLHGFTDDVIQKRRKSSIAPTKAFNPDDFDESIGEKRKMNLLDILLQSTINGEPLSDLDIREEVDTFMFEGHDTTSSGIIFCLYNIAKYPEVQRKCFQEVREVLSDDRQQAVSLTLLNNLNYLDLVIKETLRLFPSVPFIGRKLREETEIGGYTIPKDTEVVIPIYSMGRNPKLFADPLRFWPERFSLENSGINDTNYFTYIPFSAGPRNCIGQKFAVLEIKSVISKILRHFEISLAEDSVNQPLLTAELILFSESKINFHLKPRLY
ncbi:cytochrome P450 4d1-like isoform X2 [Bradysia coprophila]|uniref:cytochrome P450 4d1-like isoform X2 n=1 Tax=Bradysia coprophila TaxID=38358 RepID=UPI00187D761C|nr:cytochrome P450 4d1-like isoform X2 [Bradysia coprophila]